MAVMLLLCLQDLRGIALACCRTAETLHSAQPPLVHRDLRMPNVVRARVPVPHNKFICPAFAHKLPTKAHIGVMLGTTHLHLTVALAASDTVFLAHAPSSW